ncbi:MAG: NAD(P)/FAD-dependent oxidoreductase [Verrucomicrobiales bacterium]|nr:NAD(P)/FAD-dependent oxidoreductase [Verrucomicrobiales bacterium]
MKAAQFSDTARQSAYDAVVVGSGPNGLAAAIELAKADWKVLVVEAHSAPGGGARSDEGTLPGFVHDVCAAVHPMGVCSPLMKSLPLQDFGLQWEYSKYPLAHPLDGGQAAIMEASVDATAQRLGAADGKAYRRLYEPLVRDAEGLFADMLGPMLKLPKHLIAAAQFGVRALPSAMSLARVCFQDEPARAMLAGHAAHSVLPLDRSPSAAVGLMLAVAGHAAGWPVAKGGTGKISEAMVAYLQSLGGEVVCGWRVQRLEELPQAKAYLFDTGPAELAKIAAQRLPEAYRKKLEAYRYGPGVFKIDYALSEAIPWENEDCRQAATVHVGGWLDEVVESEKACWQGRHAEKPFVLLAQASVCDDTRAPAGKHTAWAYCHVPNGSQVDMTQAIENQIERFAPGFRDVVLQRRVMMCADYESYNANLVGGDVTGGVNDWSQLLARPALRLNPYTTPAKGVFICSASTPPGAGVHGMCGYHAARAVLLQGNKS